MSITKLISDKDILFNYFKYFSGCLLPDLLSIKCVNTKNACVKNTCNGVTYIRSACIDYTCVKNTCIGGICDMNTCIKSACNNSVDTIGGLEIYLQSSQILEVRLYGIG